MGPPRRLWGNKPGLFAVITAVFTYFAPILASFPIILAFLAHILPSITCICRSGRTSISLLSRFSRLLPYFAFGRHNLSAVLAYIAQILPCITRF